MPTNANTFNSRVTSEALEAKFRDVFPSQGGAELPQDLFASGVIQPVVDFSSVAEGSILPEYLQTAWDFSTGATQVAQTSYLNLITTPGFWQVDLQACVYTDGAGSFQQWVVRIDAVSSAKPVWAFSSSSDSVTNRTAVAEGKFIVYLRAGERLQAKCGNASYPLDIWYRQVADVNGNLVNPLGFTFT